MNSPLLVIVGETASGKTALAVELAKKFDGEIICADSWTVYRDFTIGTAKPTKAEQLAIPHHLIDIADPSEGFNAVRFQRLAKTAIVEITARGKLPIVVGGTGLYIDSLVYDYGFLPPPSPEIRAQLNAMTLTQLLTVCRERNLNTDLIDTRNKRRVIRLIENNGQQPTRQPFRSNTIVLGVKRAPDVLEKRITERVHAMISAGLVDEVSELGTRYGWDCEPMKAPGYRAIADHVLGKISLDEAISRTVRQHLQLAKKQRTWFKRNAHIEWLNNFEDAAEITAHFLNKSL